MKKQSYKERGLAERDGGVNELFTIWNYLSTISQKTTTCINHHHTQTNQRIDHTHSLTDFLRALVSGNTLFLTERQQSNNLTEMYSLTM